ncbi:uncharacterized protein LOC134720708 [Mytilus trossulus]|uniref:uncharacterized protein LOC134720708 n=1 Tax=Mytilus trossulus TaxID=6551 RepID=UPI003003AA3C
MTDFHLPIIDLSKSKTHRDELSRQLVNALETVGFLYIDNVDGADFEKMFQCSKWFFDQSNEIKRKVMRNYWNPENTNLYRGYFPVVEDYPNHNECFEFGRDISIDDKDNNPENWFYERTPWPKEDANFAFKDVFQNQYEAAHTAAMEILRLVARGVGLGEETFVEMFTDKPCSTFRLTHYPPWNDTPSPNAIITDDGKCVTLSQHTDTNFLTLICTFAYQGLEILGADGSWNPVAPRKNSFVMNIGDLFAKMTNGRFKATIHRVLDIGVDRYSSGFFLEPSYESDVGVNLLSKSEDSKHIPEKYGPYMINATKYVKQHYLEYEGLPDFENVREKYYGKNKDELLN